MPWKRIVIAAVAVLLIVGAAFAAIAPRISEEKRSVANRERKEAAQRRAAFLKTLEREQAPRRGGGQPDPVGAGGTKRVEARTALVDKARGALADDARSRDEGTIRGTDCQPFPKSEADPAEELSRSAAAYQCVAVTARFDTNGGEAGVIGVPFRLVARFAEGRYAFCRVVPLSDRDRLSYPLPSACRL